MRACGMLCNSQLSRQILFKTVASVMLTLQFVSQVLCFDKMQFQHILLLKNKSDIDKSYVMSSIISCFKEQLYPTPVLTE